MLKEKVDFRRILVTQCENTFKANEDISIDLTKAKFEGDEFINETKKKNKILGNLKFTGHLAGRDLIKNSIIFSVCMDLLEKKGDFAFESLCTLLNICLPKFIEL